MQFVVVAYDGTDEGGLVRRMAAREAHLALAKGLVDNGNWLYACAIQNDDGKAIGSVVVCEFPSRDELDQWLQKEPYVAAKVWQEVRVHRAQVAPFWARS